MDRLSRKSSLWFGVLLCLLTLAQMVHADSYEISIRIVNSEGDVVAGAIASPYWMNGLNPDEEHRVEAQDDALVVTGPDGTAKLRIGNWQRKRCVMIQSKDGTQSAIIKAGPEDHDKQFEVTLAPNITVAGQLSCEELDDIHWTNIVISPGLKKEDYLVQVRSTDGKFEFAVPPGTYTLTMYGSHVLEKIETFEIPAGEATHDLGEIPMLLNPKMRLTGKPAPTLTIAEARGVEFDPTANQNQFDLEPYRGKWVLLEFWGHW